MRARETGRGAAVCEGWLVVGGGGGRAIFGGGVKFCVSQARGGGVAGGVRGRDGRWDGRLRSGRRRRALGGRAEDGRKAGRRAMGS